MNSAPIAPRLRTARRAWALAAALLPALAVQTLALGGAVPVLAVLAVIAALFGDVLGRALRRQEVHLAATHGDAAAIGLVFALCLPGLAAAPPPRQLAALSALLMASVARNARQPAFPPAMAALAVLMFTSTATEATFDAPLWRFAMLSADRALALAYIAAGLMLLALRLLRWPAVLAALGGVALAAWTVPAPTLSPANACLLAFIMTCEPSLAAADPRARLVAAAALGALTVSLPAASGPLGALPWAALLVAAAVPWLDSLPAPRRAPERPAA